MESWRFANKGKTVPLLAARSDSANLPLALSLRALSKGNDPEAEIHLRVEQYTRPTSLQHHGRRDDATSPPARTAPAASSLIKLSKRLPAPGVPLHRDSWIHCKLPALPRNNPKSRQPRVLPPRLAIESPPPVYQTPPRPQARGGPSFGKFNPVSNPPGDASNVPPPSRFSATRRYRLVFIATNTNSRYISQTKLHAIVRVFPRKIPLNSFNDGVFLYGSLNDCRGCEQMNENGRSDFPEA